MHHWYGQMSLNLKKKCCEYCSTDHNRYSTAPVEVVATRCHLNKSKIFIEFFVLLQSTFTTEKSTCSSSQHEKTRLISNNIQPVFRLYTYIYISFQQPPHLVCSVVHCTFVFISSSLIADFLATSIRISREILSGLSQIETSGGWQACRS